MSREWPALSSDVAFVGAALFNDLTKSEKAPVENKRRNTTHSLFTIRLLADAPLPASPHLGGIEQ